MKRFETKDQQYYIRKRLAKEYQRSIIWTRFIVSGLHLVASQKTAGESPAVSDNRQSWSGSALVPEIPVPFHSLLPEKCPAITAFRLELCQAGSLVIRQYVIEGGSRGQPDFQLLGE